MPVADFKRTDRNMSRRQVEQACQRILKDMVREFGYEGPLPVIQLTDALPGTVDGRFVDPSKLTLSSEPGGVILLNETFWLPNAMDKGYGYSNFRILAHEAIHALFAKYVPGGTWADAHDLEEAGAEVLSLVYWAKNAPPFDERDVMRREDNTGWTDPGAASLARGINYPELVASLIRRSAAKVGWDQQRVRDEVERLMKLDRYDRHVAWQDTPEAPPPSGVGDTGPALALWLISGFAHHTAV